MSYEEVSELKAAQTLPVIDYSAFAGSYPVPNVGSHSIVHKDFNVVLEKESELALRKRLRGTFNTQHTESYFGYVAERIAETNAEKSRTFVDATEPQRYLKAITVLNFGDYSKPGQSDDLAILSLRQDPVFARLEAVSERDWKATEFAELLEDFLDADISAFNNGSEVGFTKAIQAIRNAKIEVLKTSKLNTNGLAHESSDMEKAAIQAEQETLPDLINLSTPIYLGLEQQQVSFRVSVKFIQREGQPTVVTYSLKPIGLLMKHLKAADNFQEIISGKLEDVSIGTFGLNR